MQKGTQKAAAERGPAVGGPSLYLVATPIGNLEDITLRALRVLKEVDLIACEDTRQTLKLLSHYGIQTRLVSYHEHNEMTKAAELIVDLEGGAKIALVTDAGMPGISDPGFRSFRFRERRHFWPRWSRVACPPTRSASADFCRRSLDSGANCSKRSASRPERKCSTKRRTGCWRRWPMWSKFWGAIATSWSRAK